jgi:4-hydroxy-tetrahydrodipicolinate synthase
MLTPFSENGDIDFHGLEALTEFYIASGASGLFANCLSSEMYQLSPEERISLTEAVVSFAADRIPVVSTGTFSKDQDENVEFISSIYDKGVIGVVINANQLCSESDGEDVFRSRLENLVEASGEIPLGIYECPEPYKRLLPEDLIAWMASTGRFSYFKDTSCDNVQIRARLSASENSLFALYNANTPTAVQSLRNGATGLSPIGANFYPELYSYLYDNALKEETMEFVKVRQFLSVNDPVLHAVYPFSAKWFLQSRGLSISTHTRTLVPKVQSEEMVRLQDLLAEMEELFEITGVRSCL